MREGKTNPETDPCAHVDFVWAGRSQDHGDDQNSYPARATRLTFTGLEPCRGDETCRRERIWIVSDGCCFFIGTAQHIHLWQLWKSVERLAFTSSSFQWRRPCRAIFAATPPALLLTLGRRGSIPPLSFRPVFGLSKGHFQRRVFILRSVSDSEAPWREQGWKKSRSRPPGVSSLTQSGSRGSFWASPAFTHIYAFILLPIFIYLHAWNQQ